MQKAYLDFENQKTTSSVMTRSIGIKTYNNVAGEVISKEGGLSHFRE